ncbi:MAG: glycosyltransferase, partial [Bacteroidota bacterium]|nr:glycosyltransferase [Bacteroidota bacterium]
MLSTPKTQKKILFATIALDGHFNPLTSLAVYLKEAGYDVRWYTGSVFKEKLQNLKIPHLPFKRAKEITQHNIDEVFPERKKIKNGIKRICFDMSQYFILRGPEFLQDVQEIHQNFPFDLMIADICFTGIPFIKEKLQVPVISIGIIPLVEKSRDTAPAGLGLTPAKTALGKKGYVWLQKVVDNFLLKQPNDFLRQLLANEGISCKGSNAFEIAIEKSTVVLQSGTPGFEYYRRDISKHIHFIGPVLPHAKKVEKELTFRDKLGLYKNTILVTQGTLENDNSKLIIPTLEAFKNTNNLVIVTTAGNDTEALRKQYPYANCVIEDYIPFNQIMPFIDVYVSNGGYGGVLLSIENRVPMVVGGKHEGKNEICARVGYFNLGINLKTEAPGKEQIKA